ncbi:hypothetical protein AB0H76_35705 [Nocardia sp. NPDC050712]|uniref:hypothetical protein n=1 Tax=Nocardia sp. NPDC050712 TaxID=3155518 RepID=UPI0033F9AE26
MFRHRPGRLAALWHRVFEYAAPWLAILLFGTFLAVLAAFLLVPGPSIGARLLALLCAGHQILLWGVYFSVVELADNQSVWGTAIVPRKRLRTEIILATVFWSNLVLISGVLWLLVTSLVA